MEPTFLGRGWSFPPTFSLATKGVEMVSGEEDIRQSLEILLNTGSGERVMRPDFGCDMGGHLFEPLNLCTRTQIEDRIKTAILYHEPRIDVNSIMLTTTEESFEGKLLISIDFTIRSTNSRLNMVFPFYLEEGSRLF